MQNHNQVQVFDKKPVDFNPKVSITAAYVEVDGRLLFMQLSKIKQEANCWGVPAGKLEINELPEEGVRRELFEETGISLDVNAQVSSLGQLYVRKPDIDYIYHAFRIQLTHTPQIILSEEHITYKWLTPHEVEELTLMAGAQEAFRFYLERVKTDRLGPSRL